MAYRGLCLRVVSAVRTEREGSGLMALRMDSHSEACEL